MSPSSTRQQILDLVSQGPVTIPELTAQLHIARNAVVVQIQKLVAEGLIRRGGHQHTGAAGKPGYVYELVPGTEDVHSQAYRPLVIQILAVLRERLEAREIADILEEAGTRLANEAGLDPNATPEERIAKAITIVNSLGACAEIVVSSGGRYVVENRRCPFAQAVRCDSCVCHAAAAFFRAATGLPFKQNCDRSTILTCRYEADLAQTAN